jgi:MFS family permease
MTNILPKEVINSTFPALKHRNFRLFWFGQCISLIGSWMQSIGQSWLVLQITDSALKLGFVTMMQFLPILFFSLFAGTLIDRFPKRKVLIFTQSSLAVLAFALATITYFQVVQYWHIVVLAVLLGTVNSIDMPTRQSFFIDLVGREDLMNAITLNSSIFNLARIIGPAVAGLLIGAVGIAVCFYINSLSFVAVIIGIWMIDVPVKSSAIKDKNSHHVISDIADGLRYINKNKIIKLPLALLGITSAFVMNYTVLVPVYAQQTLGQNATGYGLLMTFMGVGSFIGALTLAAKSKYGPSLKYLVSGALGMSIFMLILGMENNYIIACLTLFVVGLCTITFTALVNSTIQLNASDDMRGRVMSVYTLVFAGLKPVGSIYTGYVTEYFGAPGCMIISGIIGIAATLYITFLLKRNHDSITESPE